MDSLRKFFVTKKGFPNPKKVVVRAVDNISFTVGKGEVFGLVGESGCGKSTVGRSLLRLVEPDEGKVLMNGENVLKFGKKKMMKLRRRMQIIFQDPYSSLNPRRSIRNTLSEPLYVHKLGDKADIEERVYEVLNEVGLRPDAADKYPHQFSGGQRQRIGVARALLFDPDIIIADEPVSALDVSIQSQILKMMQNLQYTRRLSFVFISHDLAVVRYFCNRMAVMYLGKIVEIGSVKDAFSNPLHPYTDALRHASPIPDPKTKKGMIRLEGEVPSPINPPRGCYFHERCPKKMDICSEVYPEWLDMENGRGVACHLYP